MPTDKRTTFIHIALIIFLGLSVYANSLTGKFIWDDHLQIQDNSYLENPSSFFKLITTDIGEGGGVKCGFYRPVQMFTNFINYSIWGLNPGGYHFTNILLHVMVALSIYWLIRILFQDKLLSFLTAVFFVVHPVHTEVVSYISGRADSLGTLFLLLAFVYYVRGVYAASSRSHILVPIFYSLALLSKENTLIFPALILLYHYVFRNNIRLGKFAWIVIISLTYILLKMLLLHTFLPTRVAVAGTVWQRIPGFFAALYNYLRLLLLPFGLHMEYPHKIFAWSDPQVLSGLIIFIAMLGLLVKMRSNRLAVFSIGWFFLTLIPVNNVFWSINSSFMMEHWMYLPSIGLIVLAVNSSLAASTFGFLKMPVFIFIILVILFYSYLTVKQNSYWQDDISFYKRTLEYNPASARINYNLGLSYWIAGDIKNAIQAYKNCLAVDPKYFLAHNNLAVAYFHEDNFELALKHADRAVELGYSVDPDFLLLLKPYRDKK